MTLAEDVADLVVMNGHPIAKQLDRNSGSASTATSKHEMGPFIVFSCCFVPLNCCKSGKRGIEGFLPRSVS